MPKQELDANELYNLALSIVGLVLKEGPATLVELSNHFGVSEKAIFKAVSTISNSEDVANYKTHFYLNYDALDEGEVDFGIGEGNLEDAPVLSGSQVSALAMGLEFLASLPEFEGNADLAELRRHLANGATSVGKSLWDVEIGQLELLRNAIIDQHRVSFQYLNQLGKKTDRDVDPLRIDLIGAKHYLRAYCHTAQELRTFRVDRLSNLTISNRKIAQESLDLSLTDEIYGEGTGATVEIEASKSAEEIFWNFPSTQPKVLPDGGLRGQIKVGNLEALARHIVRYGGEVRVLAPDEARQAVAKFALAALEQQLPEVE